MQSWVFSRNRNFNCIDCKDPVADAMGFFYDKEYSINSSMMIYSTSFNT